MKLGSPQDYFLELTGDGGYRLLDKDGLRKFTAPASRAGTAKLYTISVGGVLYYVGMAFRGMAARIRGGLKATGKHGYHGYAWRGQRGRLGLSVWSVQGEGDRKRIHTWIEGVEAEVAFACRQESGHWPEFQTEIHFHKTDQEQRAIAATVYARATRR